jgi:pimeloyl-ACP methyl ester carboxylesterase
MARMVLVHGAFGGAWCWEPVVPGLQAAGHTVQTFDLPGSGADQTPVPEVTLDAYAARVGEVLAGGEPAVLIGHSMGGMVVTQAASRWPEHVARLIYVAAFIPQVGQSLLEITHLPEAAGDSVQANIVLGGDPPVAVMPAEVAKEALMHCCTDDEAQWAQARRRPQPAVPFTQPFQLDHSREAEFRALPRAYVTTLQDRAIKPAIQRLMYEAAGCDPVIEIDTDHSVWLSATDELVAGLDRIARDTA